MARLISLSLPLACLASHDVEEAVVLADWMVVIQDGEVDLDLPVQLPRPVTLLAQSWQRLRAAFCSEFCDRTAPY